LIDQPLSLTVALTEPCDGDKRRSDPGKREMLFAMGAQQQNWHAKRVGQRPHGLASQRGMEALLRFPTSPRPMRA